MGKPWARYEQNYINHPKFLALSANAICLWLEGKNYCDMHMTDGYIPCEALKTFRFHSRKSVELLKTSIGQKLNGAQWEPLWEESAEMAGYFHMHDYLDHNDCRDEVVARIEGADRRKDSRRMANRERQASYRSRTQHLLSTGEWKAPDPQREVIDYEHIIVRDGLTCHWCQKAIKREDLEFDHIVPIAKGGPHTASNIAPIHRRCNRSKKDKHTNGQNNALVLPPTETETPTETILPKKQEGHTHARRPHDTIFGNEHRSHAACGRACVPAFLHRELRARLGGDEAAADDRLRAWYLAVEHTIPDDEPVPADVLKFWRKRFDAEFVRAEIVGKSDNQQQAELLEEIQRQNRAVQG